MAKLKGEAQVQIGAPPDVVYNMVSDVTQTGRWSPECYKCEWLSGATGQAVGARFKGCNRRGWMKWTAECTVTEAVPGRAFAFETLTFRSKGPQTRWRYEMKPSNGGTLLIESFENLWYFRPIIWLFFGGPRQREAPVVKSMDQTLARIKAAVEMPR